MRASAACATCARSRCNVVLSRSWMWAVLRLQHLCCVLMVQPKLAMTETLGHLLVSPAFGLLVLQRHVHAGFISVKLLRCRKPNALFARHYKQHKKWRASVLIMWSHALQGRNHAATVWMHRFNSMVRLSQKMMSHV